MSKDIKRAIKSGQIQMRQLFMQIDGVAGVPVASKFDASAVLSITDLGAGNYTIILKRPYNVANADTIMPFFTPLTAGVDEFLVQAVAYDRVTVLCKAGGVPTDCIFMMQLVGSDARLSY